MEFPFQRLLSTQNKFKIKNKIIVTIHKPFTKAYSQHLLLYGYFCLNSYKLPVIPFQKFLS